MDNISLKLYVEDAINTLAPLSMSFIAIIRSIEANQRDVTFIRSQKAYKSSFKEFFIIDNILIEYLCVNILNVIDPKQFTENKNKEIANYDIMKLAKRISGKEKVVNAQTFRFFEFKEIYNRIDSEKLFKIKALRDQHYSHIDRKRMDDTDMLVKDILELVNLFLKMFDIIYKAINGRSIYEIPIDYNLYDVKLKAFKYDVMMQYLNEAQSPDLNILRSLNLNTNFEDSYETLFIK